MPTFEYQAVNQQGAAERGTIFGASTDQALQSLSRRGLQVRELKLAEVVGDPLAQPPQTEGVTPATEAVSAPAARDPHLEPRSAVQTAVVGPLAGRAPISDLLFFYRQLSAMLNAGVPYARTLGTLAGQAKNPKMRQVISEMKVNVEAGRPISHTMQRYPEVFSPLAVSLVRVGEESGNLDMSLRQLADYTEQEVELRNLYRRVTFYPKLVLAGSIVIVLATNAIIASMGKQGGLSSPLTNLGTWLVLGPLLVGLFLFFRVGLANPSVRAGWDRFLLSVPYLGGTLHQVSMAKFGRAFSALYKAGVPIPRAIQMGADATGNEHLRSKIYPISQRLADGGMIAPAFAESGAFSPMVLDMVSTGETTGNIDGMLNKMSDYYEDESKVRANQLGHVVGVAVYLMVAIYVGYMIISFYTGYIGGVMQVAE